MSVLFLPIAFTETLSELSQATTVSDGIEAGMYAFVADDRRYWLCTFADQNGSTWRPGRPRVLPPPMGAPESAMYQDDPMFTKTAVTVGTQSIEDVVCSLIDDGSIVEVDVRVVSQQTDVLGASYYRRIRKVFKKSVGTVSVLDTVWDAGAGLLGSATLSVVNNKPTIQLNGVLLTTVSWTYTVTVCGCGIGVP